MRTRVLSWPRDICRGAYNVRIRHYNRQTARTSRDPIVIAARERTVASRACVSAYTLSFSLSLVPEPVPSPSIHYRYESDTSVHHRVNDNHCSGAEAFYNRRCIIHAGSVIAVTSGRHELRPRRSNYKPINRRSRFPFPRHLSVNIFHGSRQKNKRRDRAKEIAFLPRRKRRAITARFYLIRRVSAVWSLENLDSLGPPGR